MALILHAHPDDETIFAGGLMLAYPMWQWHLICLTMQPDTQRAQEYAAAAAAFKNKGVNIVNHTALHKRDTGQVLSNSEYADWLASVDELANKGLKPDITFTHNAMGEYGHPHHMAVNKIAHKTFGNVWDFVFPGKSSVGPQVIKNSVNEVELSPEIARAKKEIFDMAYIEQQAGLWQGLPELMEYEFHQGPEIYTQ